MVFLDRSGIDPAKIQGGWMYDLIDNTGPITIIMNNECICTIEYILAMTVSEIRKPIS